MRQLLLLILFNFYLHSIATIEDNSNDAQRVDIEPWQFCVGCKHTIEGLHGKAQNVLNRMERKKKGSSVKAVLDIMELSQDLCSIAYFVEFQPFVMQSCLLIFQSYKDQLITPYIRAPVEDFLNFGGNLYNKQLQVCTNNIQACPMSYFQRPDIPPRNRTECNACKILGDDLELTVTAAANDTKIESLIENACGNLQLKYRPYSWLQDHCDSMFEDHHSAVVTAMKTFIDIYRQRTPDYSFSNNLCNRIFKCNFRTEDLKNGMEILPASDEDLFDL